MSKVFRVGGKVYAGLEKSGFFIQYRPFLPVCFERVLFFICFSTFTTSVDNMSSLKVWRPSGWGPIS